MVHNTSTRWVAILFFPFSLVLFCSQYAFAHRVDIFAYIEDGTLYTESYFSNGHRVKSGTVEIYDRKNRIQAKGVTDKNGIFTIPLSELKQSDNLRVSINAGMGHRGEYTLQNIKQGKSDTISDSNKSNNGITIGKIVAGIGSIFALCGIAFFISKRKRKNKHPKKE